MTNVMCGIESMEIHRPDGFHGGCGVSRGGCAIGYVQGVSAFQRWDGSLLPGFQGVVLGYRVGAPLARNTAGVSRLRWSWCGRVLPFQGGDGLFGLSSQGVALGYRVTAPSARRTTAPNAGFSAPTVPQLISPGQRPGNSSSTAAISPERAKPGRHRHAHTEDQLVEQPAITGG